MDEGSAVRGFWLGCLLLLAGLLCARASADQLGPVVLQDDFGYRGTSDAWLDRSSPRLDTTADPELRLGWAEGVRTTCLVRFDLAGHIPPDRSIRSATLQLWYKACTGVPHGAALTLKPYRIKPGMRWHEAPEGTARPRATWQFCDERDALEWSGPGGGLEDIDDDHNEVQAVKPRDGAAANAREPADWVGFDVTATVVQWQFGAENNGFLLAATGLEGDADTVCAVFVSADDPETDPNHRPRLTICYADAEDLERGGGGWTLASAAGLGGTCPSPDPFGGAILGLPGGLSTESGGGTGGLGPPGATESDPSLPTGILPGPTYDPPAPPAGPMGDALPPVADPGGPYTVAPGGGVIFDGRSSYDPDGGLITAWLWDLDNDGDYDDAAGTLIGAGYEYFASVLGFGPGEYTIGLKVQDDELEWATATTHVTVLIPEPSGLVLLLLGGWAALIRRQRHRRPLSS